MPVQASVVAPSDGQWCGSWPVGVGRGLAPAYECGRSHYLAPATQPRRNRRRTKPAVPVVHGGAADVVERPPPAFHHITVVTCSRRGRHLSRAGPVGSSDTTSTVG
jgi:hypothetical protein